MAEEILRFQLADAGLSDHITVDSAGTGDWHSGETADPRTIEILANHGIRCACISRQLRREDFNDFDLLLAMDRKNLADILAWPGSIPSKVRLFMPNDVADPYYGGREGYENMFYTIETGCANLLIEINAPARG
jgi:protein-tyrosine phosphatase